MKQPWLKALALCVLPVALAGVPYANAAEAEEQAPLTLELTGEVQGTGADYLEIDLGNLEITGTHIGIKVNPVYAVDQNGNVPRWSMFRFIFTDENGKTYDTTLSLIHI